LQRLLQLLHYCHLNKTHGSKQELNQGILTYSKREQPYLDA
jgi:hypothetical protein